MAKTYEKVVSVISKTPELRQEFEVQGLLPWLRKKSKLFAGLKTDCLKDIGRNCAMASYNKDDVIIGQGEIGDCFYIILEGKISIFIINKDKGEENELKNALDQIGAKDKEGKLDRSKLGNYVCPLGPGIPFGEVALISDDCIRTATIIAEEKTDLLVVDRTLYNRAVRDVLAREFEEKRDFIKNNSLFCNWIPKYKKQLAMALYKESFPYDSVLVKQGEPMKNVYFIISGQVEVQTDPVTHPSQYPNLYKLIEDEREKLLREKRIRPPTETSHMAQQMKKRDSSKSMKLCFQGINETIGEIEVLLDMNTYFQTAVCTEKTEVLVLELKHYERLFVKRHQHAIDKMRQNLETKFNSRTSLLTAKEKADIPLLNLLQMKLHMLNNPLANRASEKKKKVKTSVHSAEKQFLNHKGPLLDLYGPGSVFYMIRLREKSRMKLKAYQRERQNKKASHIVGHVHSIRLPQTLLMDAQMAGAQANKETHVQFDVGEIDTVAKQNAPGQDNKENNNSNSDSNNNNNSSSSRVKSASNDLEKGETRSPRSFRRIQSATRAHLSHTSEGKRSEYAEETNGTSHNDEQQPHGRPLSVASSEKRYGRKEQEATLGMLESKVNEWLRKGNPRGKPNVTRLRRLPVEEMETKPRPGNRIVLRRRRPKTNISDITGNDITGNDSTGSNSTSDGLDLPKHDTDVYNLDKFKILLTN